MMMSAIAVEAANFVAAAPLHGVAIARPIPAPTKASTREDAAMARAPAKIALNETAERRDSSAGAAFFVVGAALRSRMSAAIDVLAQWYRKAIKMMIGIGTPRSQRRRARPMKTSPKDHALSALASDNGEAAAKFLLECELRRNARSYENRP